jgi:hypothetical protein
MNNRETTLALANVRGRVIPRQMHCIVAGGSWGFILLISVISSNLLRSCRA